MFFLASRGYRCIAHDRLGQGRSSQPWNGNDLDTYADDLAKRSTCRTKSMSVTPRAVVKSPRYIGRHSTKRVAKGVLIGS
jgi:non-heme chloroperoxidase